MSVAHANEPAPDERRGPHRPSTGDRQSCPCCGDVMRFYERYVVRTGDTSVMQPAWVCRCGTERYVREEYVRVVQPAT